MVHALLRSSRSCLAKTPSKLLRFSSTHRSSDVVKLAHEVHLPPGSSGPAKCGPLVVMHGLFGSKQNNRSISKALARDLRTPVYTLDLRNHGDSPHVKQHDYEFMAADVEHFLREKELGPEAVLVGHSMGAKTAMAVALRRPEMVSKIIAVDNAPVEAQLSSSFGSYVQAMRRIEEAKVTKQSEADKILEEYEKHIGIRQFLLTNLVKDRGAQHYMWRIPVGTLASALDRLGSFPYHPDKVRFEKPALFVRGTKSHYVPDEVLPVMGQFFPMFQVRDIDAGHWVISEKPNEFKEVALDFLSGED